MLMNSSRFLTAVLLILCGRLAAAPTLVTVDGARILQRFDGLGCGAIFYEGHITSLAERGKTEDQERLYDAMFKDVRADFLHLYIRHDHEPQNDNGDPWKAEFRADDFKYCAHTLAICAAARKRASPRGATPWLSYAMTRLSG